MTFYGTNDYSICWHFTCKHCNVSDTHLKQHLKQILYCIFYNTHSWSSWTWWLWIYYRILFAFFYCLCFSHKNNVTCRGESLCHHALSKSVKKQELSYWKRFIGFCTSCKNETNIVQHINSANKTKKHYGVTSWSQN